VRQTMLPLLWVLLTTALAAFGQPVIQNASFEQDAFSVSPGYSRQNGGAISGWQGGSGVNPIWEDPRNRKGPQAPFWDNGKLPRGRQLAFIQGPGRLAQLVPGFEAARRYRVTYRENARVHKPSAEARWPVLEVSLGDQIVVSPHEVTPVTRAKDFTAPFVRVVSGEFAAPRDGPFELVFRTTQQQGSMVLLDDVRIEQVGEGG